MNQEILIPITMGGVVLLFIGIPIWTFIADYKHENGIDCDAGSRYSDYCTYPPTICNSCGRRLKWDTRRLRLPNRKKGQQHFPSWSSRFIAYCVNENCRRSGDTYGGRIELPTHRVRNTFEND